jgi:phenylalanyl-tRNA synthetase beta chain
MNWNFFKKLFGTKTETKFPGFIVAEVKGLKPHPNADKLQLVDIDNGNGILEIVCGAKNMKVGDKVVLATLGAKLPNGMEIKEATIRGVKSTGMLCAVDELGIGEDHSGILILDSKAKNGEAIDEYLK